MRGYKIRAVLFLFYFWNTAVVYAEIGEDKSARPPWYIGLFWNLLGYATVIIPGAIIIRLVKKSNLNDSPGMVKFVINLLV